MRVRTTTDITSLIDRKTRALACYQSQRATAKGAGQAGRDSLIWPHHDGLIWPHPPTVWAA